MNHLAHLFLSGENKSWLTGNFITDFLSPSDQREMPMDIRNGIRIHLFIDQTIDNHPVYKKSRELIRSTQGKYAPVVADIYYDYLLYNHWNLYSLVPIEDFKNQAYEAIRQGLPEKTPERIRTRINNMLARDFLHAYSSPGYMEDTFRMLSKRVHFNHNLNQAASDYQMNLPALNAQFMAVFPQMIEACLAFRLNLQN